MAEPTPQYAEMLNMARESLDETEKLCEERDIALERIAELEAALTNAIEAMRDMRSYVPPYFAAKWGHDAMITAAVAALNPSPKEADSD